MTERTGNVELVFHPWSETGVSVYHARDRMLESADRDIANAREKYESLRKYKQELLEWLDAGQGTRRSITWRRCPDCRTECDIERWPTECACCGGKWTGKEDQREQEVTS